MTKRLSSVHPREWPCFRQRLMIMRFMHPLKYICGILLLLGSSRAAARVPCDSSLLPLVLVHGFLASGDTWAGQAQRFVEQGYCRERIYAFDWNTLGGRNADSLLNVFIDGVLQRSGARQVNLAGHSAGGGLCYRYLRNPEHARKVAHYAHIGSGALTVPAGDRQQVPTLIIRSRGDRVVRDTLRSAVPTLELETADHLQTAASAESFRSLYRFFHGTAPAPRAEHLKPGGPVRLAGRVVSLGDNQPARACRIRFFQLDAASGARRPAEALHEIRPDETGHWGPLEVPRGACLEAEMIPDSGRVISYFFEPFEQDNGWVYLRTLPLTGFGAFLLKKLPAYPDRATLAVFSQSAAIQHGRDSVTVNGYPLHTAALAAPEATLIAAFLFDDGDRVSSGARIPQFGNGIFLQAMDLCIPAPDRQPVNLFFNGRTLHLPAQPGSSRIMVAVFQ